MLGWRFPRRGRGFWFSLAIDLIWPLLAAFTRLRLRGGENVPRTGGVILAANHLSGADPIVLTAYALSTRRIPRYLARANLWDVPVVGRVLRGGGHIPVHRGTTDAVHAYRDAVTALERGECVTIYPEATYTDQPDHWPSARVKNGVARIALATGVPVVPVAIWGTHRVLPHDARFPRLLPRHDVTVVAGPPVPLDDLIAKGGIVDRETADAATKRIMTAVTGLLAGIRGEQPPVS